MHYYYYCCIVSLCILLSCLVEINIINIMPESTYLVLQSCQPLSFQLLCVLPVSQRQLGAAMTHTHQPVGRGGEARLETSETIGLALLNIQYN